MYGSVAVGRGLVIYVCAKLNQLLRTDYLIIGVLWQSLSNMGSIKNLLPI